MGQHGVYEIRGFMDVPSYERRRYLAGLNVQLALLLGWEFTQKEVYQDERAYWRSDHDMPVLTPGKHLIDIWKEPDGREHECYWHTSSDETVTDWANWHGGNDMCATRLLKGHQCTMQISSDGATSVIIDESGIGQGQTISESITLAFIDLLTKKAMIND
jgi:hypothetical protein